MSPPHSPISGLPHPLYLGRTWGTLAWPLHLQLLETPWACGLSKGRRARRVSVTERSLDGWSDRPQATGPSQR